MVSLARLAFLLSAGLGVVSCGKKEQAAQQAPPPVDVATARVDQGDATYFDSYPATVTPLKQVELVAMASGYVTGIYFEDGQRVRKGQRLYKIDQDQYQAGIDQAAADLSAAEANERRAKKDVDRYQELDKQEAIARQVLDNAVAELEAAQMRVKAAKAALDRTKVSLDYANISAPFSGTMGISQVRLGALVSSGQTLLNTLSTDDPMAVDVAVDQKEIPRFTKLLQNGSKNADSLFSLTLPDGSIYPRKGRIELIDRAVNAQTGTIKTRLVFPNPDGMLRPGMTCNLRVRNSTGGSSLMIPQKATVEQMGEFFVYVVQGDSVVQRQIKPGNVINGKIVVREGLNENDEVVTEGVQKLRNGAKVKTGTAAPAPRPN
ncbi:multidrug efflux RND transporter periplasmic adaptor subunit AcrA [Rhabdobacter roseus]